MKDLEVNPTTLQLYTQIATKPVTPTVRSDQFSFLVYSFDNCTVQGWMSAAPGTFTCAGMGNSSSWKSDNHFSFPMKRKPCCIPSAGMGGSGDSSLC